MASSQLQNRTPEQHITYPTSRCVAYQTVTIQPI